MTEVAAATPVKVGDVVIVNTETRRETVGLVTVVHGEFGKGFTPCINVVYVSDDEAARDPYGRQLERMSSLQHKSQVQSMPHPGRYWANL